MGKSKKTNWAEYNKVCVNVVPVKYRNKFRGTDTLLNEIELKKEQANKFAQLTATNEAKFTKNYDNCYIWS